jgi:hypothetical protein
MAIKYNNMFYSKAFPNMPQLCGMKKYQPANLARLAAMALTSF